MPRLTARRSRSSGPMFGTKVGGGGATSAPSAIINTYATFDPAAKATNHTLSNGNLTITNAATSVAGNTLVTMSKSSGKWYFEFSINTTGGSYHGGGLANSGSTRTAQPGSEGSVSGFWVRTDTHWYWNNSESIIVGDFVSPNILGFALDVDARTLDLYKNNVFAANIPSTQFPTGALYVMYGNGDATSYVITANFGASAFSYTPPNGYNPGLYN